MLRTNRLLTILLLPALLFSACQPIQAAAATEPLPSDSLMTPQATRVQITQITGVRATIL